MHGQQYIEIFEYVLSEDFCRDDCHLRMYYNREYDIFTWIGSVWEQRAEGNVWTYKAEHNSGLEKSAWQVSLYSPDIM